MSVTIRLSVYDDNIGQESLVERPEQLTSCRDVSLETSVFSDQIKIRKSMKTKIESKIVSQYESE